ncbi:hypothetical protein BJF90_37345 [Pseudonocardia sp. CNS-004]|nr:hypothetical protein BJF90_37345 [Pseudonocardia sp. CNS-004]
MRITISIDERLWVEVRRFAAARRQTLGQVVEDSVRANLLRWDRENREPFELRTFHAGDFQAGIDLDDDSAVLELMDGRP